MPDIRFMLVTAQPVPTRHVWRNRAAHPNMPDCILRAYLPNQQTPHSQQQGGYAT
jgi:hypothetical protein